jgi:hypothetical protein
MPVQHRPESYGERPRALRVQSMTGAALTERLTAVVELENATAVDGDIVRLFAAAADRG